MLSFSATACLLYLINSVLSRTFFIFLKVFLSIGFVRSVISNTTTLTVYHVLFCLSTTFLLSAVRSCQIMSCPAVSLTILSSEYYSVNPFFIQISFFYIIQASKGGSQLSGCQIAQSRDCFCGFGRKLENLSMPVYLQ